MLRSYEVKELRRNNRRAISLYKEKRRMHHCSLPNLKISENYYLLNTNP